jgi:hypothetical protein
MVQTLRLIGPLCLNIFDCNYEGKLLPKNK